MLNSRKELEDNLLQLEKKIDEAIELIGRLRKENELLKEKLKIIESRTQEALQRLNKLLDNFS
jgi:FtsZ-binding cell division protein ZapB